MQLLTAWKDSLTLLWPRNFLLFAGAACLALVRTYRAWLGYWWWLIALVCFMYLLYGPNATILFHDKSIFSMQSLVGFPFFLMIYTLELLQENLINAFVLMLYGAALFMLYLSARPSVEPKKYDYFLSYAPHALMFAGWFFVVRSLVFIMLVFPVLMLALSSLPYYLVIITLVFVWLVYGMIVAFCIAMPALCVFFLLDSSGTLIDMLRSVWRSIKMTFLNLPLLCILIGISLGMMVLLSLLSTIILCWLSLTPRMVTSLLSVIHILSLPVPITLFATVYIKRLYDNSALYLE